jgi:hypothetical protein
MKTCKICNTDKDLSCFDLGKNGHLTRCKDCRSRLAKEARQRSRIKEAQKPRKRKPYQKKIKSRKTKKVSSFQMLTKVNKLKMVRGTYYKACKNCKCSKHQSEYYKCKNRHDGLHSYCKGCFVQHKLERQKLLKWDLIQDQGGECRKCGKPATRENQTKFDFHHVDPDTKVAEISTLMRTANKQAVRDEAKKCTLLCKPCHEKEHLA